MFADLSKQVIILDFKVQIVNTNLEAPEQPEAFDLAPIIFRII